MNENIQEFDHLQEPTFNYQEFLYKCYHYWYLFALTVVLSLVIVFFFNKFARPVYEVKSTVLIKDKSENKINPQDMLGIGMFNNTQNLQNEIEILTSTNLVNRTIQKIGYEVSYFSSDKFLYREFYRQNPIKALKRYYNGNPFYSSSELFRETPFRVIMDTSYPQPVNMKFNLTFISPTQFKLEADAEEVSFYDFAGKTFVKNRIENVQINTICYFQQVIQRKDFRFKVILTDNFDEKQDYKKTFSFMFRDYQGLVGEFRSFTVAPVKKDASVILVKLQSTNADKSADFINALTNEYLIRGLEKKNIVATRTINFIDHELMGISDSLNMSERVLMNFRTNKEVMNLDAQAQQVFDQMIKLQDEKAIPMVLSKYLLNMKESLEQNKKFDELIIPASMGIENPVLNDLAMQLTTLYIKRTETSQYSKSKNPTLLAIDVQIATIKNALYENIMSAIKTNDIALKDINDRIAGITGRINNLPETQRVLFGIERKFKLIDASYTFLLQKRSEAQITRAANTPDNEIIDKADNTAFKIVFPNKSQNFIIALLLGILLPILYILGKDYFNKAIMTREDIEKMTQLPFLGQLLHSKKGSRVVIDSPNSTSTEAFRTVRTNIN